MKRFTRGLMIWLMIGLKMAADGLREPRKKKVVPKPLWYDRVNDKEDRAN